MYSNYTNVPFVLAVWLAANDGYDLKAKKDVISATSLLKPTKSLVLSARLAAADQETQIDLSDLIPSRLGTAVHTAVENSWLYSREKGLKQLGIPKATIDRLRINPSTPGKNTNYDIYMEQRSEKKIGKWTISGKFDFVHNNRVKDIKTTKTYNWIKGSNDKKYAIQGSIYRWLNPEIITDDFIDVLMIFTDWSQFKAMADKDYPQTPIKVRTIPLMTIPETERWIKSRLAEIEANWDKRQVDMPLCTPEELWMDPPKYAYYKNPKAQRATRIFNTADEAHSRKAQDGIPGSTVVFRQSNPKFCQYCDARVTCLQAEQYIAQGVLKL